MNLMDRRGTFLGEFFWLKLFLLDLKNLELLIRWRPVYIITGEINFNNVIYLMCCQYETVHILCSIVSLEISCVSDTCGTPPSYDHCSCPQTTVSGLGPYRE